MTYATIEIDVYLEEFSNQDILDEIFDRLQIMKERDPEMYRIFLGKIRSAFNKLGDHLTLPRELYFTEKETLKRVVDNLDQFTEQEFIKFLNDKR